MPTLTLLFVACAAIFAAAPSSNDSASLNRPHATKAELSAMLEHLVAEQCSLADDDFVLAAKKVAASFAPDSRAGDRLARGIVATTLDTREVAKLRELVRELNDDFLFQPKLEAKTPRGWPSPTTPGEIEVKSYPAYRMAKTKMADGASNGAFWTLFNHIKSHEIPMTAPVQNDYPDNASSTMAFLYESDEAGELGKDGSVDVVLVEPMTTLSIGIRGPATREKILEAAAALDRRLESDARYVAIGGYRTMGWSSPYVPNAKKFTEVQIQVKAIAKESARKF